MPFGCYNYDQIVTTAQIYSCSYTYYYGYRCENTF